jgi:hypothetical protein
MRSALSDERTGLSFTLLLALADAVILGSESRGTRGHTLLSQIRDFSFRRLLRLAGLRLRYSTPPPPGIPHELKVLGRTNPHSPLIRQGPHRKWYLHHFFVSMGISLPNFYLIMIDGCTDRPIHSPLLKHGRYNEWRFQHFFYYCVYSLPVERAYRAVA